MSHRRNKMTVSQFADWHDDLICDKPRGTRDNYRNAFDHLASVVGGQTTLDRVDATSVAQLKQKMGVNGQGFAEATQDKIVSHLRAAWNRAVRFKFTRENPFTGQGVRWDPRDIDSWIEELRG